MLSKLRVMGALIVLLAIAVSMGFWFLAKSSNHRAVQSPQSQTGTVAPAPRSADIDLISGTVNGQAMAELTPDTVTDLFGRPSATTEPRISPGVKAAGMDIPESEIPSTLVYGDLGLIFRFLHPRLDPRQTIASILVFLSQQPDKKTRTIMKPYSGALSRNVNGNWKVNRVMEEFAQFSPIDGYDVKRAQDLRELNGMAKALGMDRSAEGLENSISFMTTIRFNTPQTFVNFNYQEQTKFLERLEVGPQRKDTKTAIKFGASRSPATANANPAMGTLNQPVAGEAENLPSRAKKWVLAQPVIVQALYGSTTLSIGTEVELVSQDASHAHIRYAGRELIIPSSAVTQTK